MAPYSTTKSAHPWAGRTPASLVPGMDDNGTCMYCNVHCSTNKSLPAQAGTTESYTSGAQVRWQAFKGPMHACCIKCEDGMQRHVMYQGLGEDWIAGPYLPAVGPDKPQELYPPGTLIEGTNIPMIESMYGCPEEHTWKNLTDFNYAYLGDLVPEKYRPARAQEAATDAVLAARAQALATAGVEEGNPIAAPVPENNNKNGNKGRDKGADVGGKKGKGAAGNKAGGPPKNGQKQQFVKPAAGKPNGKQPKGNIAINEIDFPSLGVPGMDRDGNPKVKLGTTKETGVKWKEDELQRALEQSRLMAAAGGASSSMGASAGASENQDDIEMDGGSARAHEAVSPNTRVGCSPSSGLVRVQPVVGVNELGEPLVYSQADGERIYHLGKNKAYYRFEEEAKAKGPVTKN